MPKFEVRIEDSGDCYPCADSKSLLEGMESLGRRGIPVGCRNGGCGVCKVRITSGSYVSRVMSRAHVSPQDEEAGIVLACRVRPTSDVSLEVLGGMKKSLCRAAGQAGSPSH